MNEELEFEPGIKFWDRPIFSQVDSHIWKVIGAHDFSEVKTHGVNSFERWHYTGDADHMCDLLTATWPTLRAEAATRGLGTAWLRLR